MIRPVHPYLYKVPTMSHAASAPRSQISAGQVFGALMRAAGLRQTPNHHHEQIEPLTGVEVQESSWAEWEETCADWYFFSDSRDQ